VAGRGRLSSSPRPVVVTDCAAAPVWPNIFFARRKMDIKPLLDRLRIVSNDELRVALLGQKLTIDNDKFTTAFQCVGACHDLGRPDILFGQPPGMREEVARGGRFRASVVFMVFTALCYMRSEHLERGLDDVSEDSPLRAFRDIYRAGSTKQGDDTLVQHVRNALAHGSFRLGRQVPEIHFTDRAWNESFAVPHLLELCEHVHRLYHEAFSDPVPRPPHWSKYGRHS
jgi:hypothetical protein